MQIIFLKRRSLSSKDNVVHSQYFLFYFNFLFFILIIKKSKFTYKYGLNISISQDITRNKNSISDKQTVTGTSNKRISKTKNSFNSLA